MNKKSIQKVLALFMVLCIRWETRGRFFCLGKTLNKLINIKKCEIVRNKTEDMKKTAPRWGAVFFWRSGRDSK